MRKYLLVFVCMMAVMQHVGAQDYFSSASDFARLYVGVLEPQYPKLLWQELPYYKGNSDMYRGRVSYYGVVYEDVQLRFDQMMQRVVVLSPVGNYSCLPEQEHIDWFEMDGQRFVHDPEDSSRYAALLCDGSRNGIRLYHCLWKVYNGEKNFGGKKYLKTFYTKEHYTLVTPDGKMHHVKKASDVAKLFPEQRTQIKQMARKYRLSFSKSEREKSLTSLIEVISGPTPLPLPVREGSGYPQDGIANVEQAEKLSSPFPHREGQGGGSATLIPGIPVLDSDSLTATTAKKNAYIVPGVKKAKVSIADVQELDEIVVVGGRLSAVESLMMGSEKFKPQVLKNIPSALGESDIMKIVLTLPGVTTVGEASSGYNVRGGATDSFQRRYRL